MDTIAPMIRQQLTDHIRNESVEHRDQTLDYHRQIVEKIEARDSDAARQAMYEHLTDSRRDARQETLVRYK